MIVTDIRVARFVGERVGVILYPPFTCMGIERDGKIIIGLVFNCFTGTSVEVTAAGRGWTKGLLREVGQYVFEQLGCCRMTFTTESAQVVRNVQKLGGQIEGCLRDQFGPGRDGIVLGVLKEEYRFK